MFERFYKDKSDEVDKPSLNELKDKGDELTGPLDSYLGYSVYKKDDSMYGVDYRGRINKLY